MSPLFMGGLPYLWTNYVTRKGICTTPVQPNTCSGELTNFGMQHEKADTLFPESAGV